MRCRPDCPFRERDPRPIGAIGLLVLALFVVAGRSTCRSCRCIGGGDTYHAAFAEAGGLQGRRPGADRRREGRQGHRRRPGGRARDGDVHGPRAGRGSAPRTAAAVKLQDLAGQEVPRARPGRAGPAVGRTRRSRCRRTTPSYDVVDAFTDLTTTTEQIDTGQLARSLDDARRPSSRTARPRSRRRSTGCPGCPGPSPPATTQLRQLLARAQARHRHAGRAATRQVASADQGRRRCCCRSWTRRAGRDPHPAHQHRALAQQLTGLVQDNRAQLGPALAELHGCWPRCSSTRTTWTPGSRRWRRSPGSSPTPSATAAGSTPASRTWSCPGHAGLRRPAARGWRAMSRVVAAGAGRPGRGAGRRLAAAIVLWPSAPDRSR